MGYVYECCKAETKYLTEVTELKIAVHIIMQTSEKSLTLVTMKVLLNCVDRRFIELANNSFAV